MSEPETNFSGFPQAEDELFIAGPAGRIQVLATPGKQKSGQAQSDAAIICHPHSLMGGSMNNKVVHTLARAHRDLGHAAVRFNFRGVDKSEGEYSEGIGEAGDLKAVIQWVRHCFPEANLWLAGFSFGAFVAAKTCRQLQKEAINLHQLMLVAPAVTNYPFAEMQNFPAPLVMLYGNKDEVVDAGKIKRWFEAVDTAKDSACFDGAGHFFHGRLPELKKTVEKYVAAAKP